jgi:hypothetical protein
MYGSRFVCEMFAVDLDTEPDNPGQDQPTDEDGQNLHPPSALFGFYLGDFLFHAITPSVGIASVSAGSNASTGRWFRF